MSLVSNRGRSSPVHASRVWGAPAGNSRSWSGTYLVAVMSVLVVQDRGINRPAVGPVYSQ